MAAIYRDRLPQLEEGSSFAITDGGLETSLIFHQGIELPEFAAFVLLDRQGGPEILQDHLAGYAVLAKQYDRILLADTPTWRASRAWGEKIGYTSAEVERANRRAVALLLELRDRARLPRGLVISAAVGPRGDGYQADAISAEEAEEYHSEQISVFADTAADFVSAYTMTGASEAIGIVRAARMAAIPVVISFTVETDGRLPNGAGLADAIREVDAATAEYAAYFMINCAHPDHFAGILDDPVLKSRLRGLRTNASSKSHAELDEATTLDQGDPDALGRAHHEILVAQPWIRVLGGCCGTDHRHLAAILEACAQS